MKSAPHLAGHETKPVPVHLLIARRDIGMSIRALRSLVACNDQPLRLVWHEDGLDDYDIERINKAFPENSEVLRRPVADEMMAEALRDYPLCREFRRRHVMGLKLIDPLHDPSETFMIYDSDIVTMRPVTGFSSFPDDETDLVFMYDRQYSYGFKLEQSLFVQAGKLTRRLNAGCMLVRRSSVSYALMESVFEKYPGLLERNDDQTPWALIAGGLNARMWDPSQVAIAMGTEESLRDCAVLHFTQPVRSMFDNFAKLSEAGASSAGSVTLRTVPSTRFGRLELFCEILERKMINSCNRMRGAFSRFGF